jgi:hypothetical protein
MRTLLGRIEFWCHDWIVNYGWWRIMSLRYRWLKKVLGLSRNAVPLHLLSSWFWSTGGLGCKTTGKQQFTDDHWLRSKYYTGNVSIRLTLRRIQRLYWSIRNWPRSRYSPSEHIRGSSNDFIWVQPYLSYINIQCSNHCFIRVSCNMTFRRKTLKLWWVYWNQKMSIRKS